MVTHLSVNDSQDSHKLSQDAQHGRARFGWLRRRRDDDPTPASFFTDPAPTQRLPRVTTDQPSAHPNRPPAVHRDQSTNPDPVALHIAELCIQAVRQGWSSTRLNDVLLAPLGALHTRAMREQTGGEKIAQRVERNLAEAERMAAGLAAADAVGGLNGINPALLGRTLAARAVHAHTPEAPTGLLPVITEDMPDPRAAEVRLERKRSEPGTVLLTVASGVPMPESPVHRDEDGTIPPVPDGPVPADEELPHRESKSAVGGAEGGEPR